MATDDFDAPPPWFEDDDDSGPWPGWVKLLVFAVAALVVVVLVLIPVLQVAVLREDSPRPPGDSPRNAAIVFASSVLERRSLALAMDVAVPDLEPQVTAIIADLSEESAARYRDATLRISQTRCPDPLSPAEQCFIAALARQEEIALFIIAYGIAVIDGEARVVAVTRVGTTV